MPAALRWFAAIAGLIPAIFAQTPGTPSGLASGALDSLPLPFDFWAVYQTIGPSAVTEPLRLGGLSTSQLPLASSEAASWVYTGYRLHGVPASDPYQPGRPLFFLDPGVIETSGAGLQDPPLAMPLHPEAPVALRAPESHWRGSAAAYLTGSALAGDNRPASAPQAGLLQPEQFRWYTLNRFAASGPVGSRSDLTVSAAGRWAEQSAPRQAAPASTGTRVLTAAARARVRTNNAGRFAAGFTLASLYRSAFGVPAGFEILAWRRAGPPFRPHERLRERNRFASLDIAWHRAPSAPAGNWELRYGYIPARLRTDSPSPAGTLARIELLDGSASGPPPLANDGSRGRHDAALVWSRQARDPAAPVRQLRAGISAGYTAARNRWTAPGDAHLILAAGRPATALLLNTPLDSKGRGRSFAAHLAASFRPLGPLQAHAGLRFDHRRAGLPAQSSPAGAYWPSRNFSSAGTLIRWTTLSPRAAVSLRLPGRWLEAFRLAYSRFQQPLALAYADYGNPNSLSGLEYRWRDVNGDGAWQPGETGRLLRRFGGLYSAIDPDLQSPRADEFRASLSAELPGGIRATLEGFRRDYRRRLAARNAGVPFDLPSGAPSYRPVPILDPGPDARPGTFDDQPLTVYSQDPSTFGKDRFVLSNVDAGAFSAGIVAQLAGEGRSYWWRAGFAAEKGYGATAFGNDPWQNDPGVPGSFLQDPNELLHATGRFFTDRAYVGRLLAVWRAPKRLGGFELGLAAAYWDGLPFARKLLVEGLEQGPAVVLATPRGSPEGGHRTEFNLAVDLRIVREFEAGPGALRLVADIFNLPNLGLNLRERDLSGPDFNARLPVAIQPPRFVRAGVEYRF